MANITFEYDQARINDLKVITEENERTGRKRVSAIQVGDRTLTSTPRFWSSFFSRFGISNSIFTYYSHEEVLTRIAEIDTSSVRTCFAVNQDTGEESMLAISNLQSPIITYDDLTELLSSHRALSFNYADGVVESSHLPRVGGDAMFDILGDAFQNQFVMQTPVDGYGLPAIYLSMLRDSCKNGVIAIAKIFKSGLSVGKKDDGVNFVIERALEGFNNEEGYGAIKQRILASGQSWASVFESEKLYSILLKLHIGAIAEVEVLGQDPIGGGLLHKLYESTTTRNTKASDTASPILNAFSELTGDVTRLYGVTNASSIGDKKQRILPVKCSVYELMNFATEVATHHAGPIGRRLLNGWVGDLLSNEYDMEGTKAKMPLWSDFHIDQSLTASSI